MCVPLLLQLHARGRTARGTRGLRSTAQWPRNDRFQQLLDELNVHAEVGDVAQAEECFQELQRLPGSRGPKRRMLHNTMLKACANAGAFRRALVFFSRMQLQGVRASPRTLNKLLICAARSNELSWQQRLLKEAASELGLQADQISLAAVLDLLARQGQATEAAELVEASNVVPDQKTLGTMVKAFAKADKPQEAVAWLERMKEPDLEHFQTVAHGFARQGQVPEVELWLSRATHASHPPDLVGYGCLVDACAKASQVQPAIDALSRARAAQLQPNSTMYNSALDACAKQGNVLKAEELFKTIKAQHLVTLEGITSMVRATRSRAWQESEAWLASAREAQLEPDTQLINVIISACAKASSAERCIFWLDEMQRRSLAPNAVTFSSALGAC
ncbi:Pentatricopeptide repeat-containing protein At1g63130, partial [Durusdinium trenchii]